MTTDPWHTLRIRRRWALAMWLGWLPFGFAMMNVDDRFLPSPWPMVLTLFYMAGFVIVGIRASTVPCPQCGQPFVSLFHAKRRAPWIWRCDHCDIKLGDPIRQSSEKRHDGWRRFT